LPRYRGGVDDLAFQGAYDGTGDVVLRGLLLAAVLPRECMRSVDLIRYTSYLSLDLDLASMAAAGHPIAGEQQMRLRALWSATDKKAYAAPVTLLGHPIYYTERRTRIGLHRRRGG
jgi:hypothetical protein